MVLFVYMSNNQREKYYDWELLSLELEKYIVFLHLNLFSPVLRTFDYIFVFCKVVTISKI